MKLFSSLLVLSSLAVSSFASTVSDIRTDIASTSSEFNALDVSIRNFPNNDGTMAQTFVVHNHFVATSASVDKCTADIKTLSPTPPSEPDARTILTLVESLQAAFENTLADFVMKRSAFQNVPGDQAVPLMGQDLTNLRTSVTALERTLISLIPSDLLSEATMFEQVVDAAFDAATDAYT